MQSFGNSTQKNIIRRVGSILLGNTIGIHEDNKIVLEEMCQQLTRNQKQMMAEVLQMKPSEYQPDSIQPFIRSLKGLQKSEDLPEDIPELSKPENQSEYCNAFMKNIRESVEQNKSFVVNSDMATRLLHCT